MMNSNEFKEVFLKDVLAEKGYIRGPFGSALKRSEMSDEGIPVYEQQNAIYDNREFRYYINEDKYESLKRFTTLTDDLIISCSGTVGKVSIIKKEDPKGIISQALLTLRVNKEIILPEYLKYFFSSYEGYNALVSRSSGSVQVNISKRAVIEEIPLKLPNLEIQKKIVYYLKSIDDKIEVNQKINQNLEKQMQTIFNNYFIDFKNYDDPEMVNSKLGLIPKDWTIVKLNDLVIKNNEKIKEFDDWKDELLIDLSNMPRFSMSLSNFDKGEKLNSNIYKLNKFDLLFGSIRPYFGKAGFSPIDGVRAGTILSFKPKNNIYYSFLLALIVSKEFINYTVSVSKGTKMPSVKWKDFVDYDVVIPKNEYIMEDFNNKLIGFVYKIQKNVIEIIKLIEIRDILLPKLMSGKIDVSDVEI